MLFKKIAADTVRRTRGTVLSPRTAAIIVAAGNSTRMGSKISKQLIELDGIPVLARTMLAFQHARSIDEIVIVAREEDIAAIRQLAADHGIKKLTQITCGGETRAASVRRGFRKIHPKTAFVAIHDGARCLITPSQISKVCRAAYRHRAATAATSVTDTVKLANRRGFITSTVDRKKVYLVQTPQVFHANLYRAALDMVNDDSLTDDNQLMERIQYPVKLVDLGKDNIKITTPDDLPRAEFILKERK